MEEKPENMAEKPRIARSRGERKPKKVQISYGILCAVIILAIGCYLNSINVRLALFWGFGIAFGFVLQRSRFCFTAAFRDPWLTGSTSITRAVLVALALGTIGFAAIKFAAQNTENNLNMMNVVPIGLPLILGAFLFGIGMVIAGGCASGTLMRIGEGFTMQALALIFFIAGTMWGVHDWEWWEEFNKSAPKVFLPDVFGWFGALIVQGIIILLLYIAAVKWQAKKMGPDAEDH